MQNLKLFLEQNHKEDTTLLECIHELDQEWQESNQYVTDVLSQLQLLNDANVTTGGDDDDDGGDDVEQDGMVGAETLHALPDPPTFPSESSTTIMNSSTGLGGGCGYPMNSSREDDETRREFG